MNSAVLQSVLATVEGNRDRDIELLRAMIAAQETGEDAVQSIVADRLAEAGAHVERVVYDPAAVPLTGEFAAERAIAAGFRTNVVGSVSGDGSGRSLILFAHPDSEPVRAAAWQQQPFAGTIADGRLYGWGVADDLLGVAAGVASLTALAQARVRPGGTVTMASTPSKRHARGVAAILHHGLTADAAVYLHPAESGAGLAEIKALASGQLLFRVTVTGRPPPTTEPGHTAFAHLAANPIDAALVVIAALRMLDARREMTVRHPWLDTAVGRSTNLLISHIASGEAGLFGRVAPSCTIEAAISFPPNEAMSSVQAQIEAAIVDAARNDPWLCDHPPSLEWVSGVTGAETADDHPLYRTVADAVTAVTGIVPTVNALHTSSDIRNPIVQKSIPTVGLGPRAGNLTQAGKTDEWVDVDDYLAMIKVVASIIVTWTGATPH